MTLFINLRATPSGGICAAEARLVDNGNQPLDSREFTRRIRGKHVVLATHGFNVSEAGGIEALTRWEALCQMPSDHLFVGVLWAGDSRFLPIIDYPVEGVEALASGRLLAGYLNRYGSGAASISLASHSLGARTMLEALRGLKIKARHIVLMAGAIEDDCLTSEYADAAANVEKIHILASRSDFVLAAAFPIGNLVGEIIMRGHPYFQAALGREGPAQPISLAQLGNAWQIPDGWGFGHLDYLPDKDGQPPMPSPVEPPAANGSGPPGATGNNWKPSWSAAVLATQTR